MFSRIFEQITASTLHPVDANALLATRIVALLGGQNRPVATKRARMMYIFTSNPRQLLALFQRMKDRAAVFLKVEWLFASILQGTQAPIAPFAWDLASSSPGPSLLLERAHIERVVAELPVSQVFLNKYVLLSSSLRLHPSFYEIASLWIQKVGGHVVGCSDAQTELGLINSGAHLYVTDERFGEGYVLAFASRNFSICSFRCLLAMMDGGEWLNAWDNVFHVPCPPQIFGFGRVPRIKKHAFFFHQATDQSEDASIRRAWGIAMVNAVGGGYCRTIKELEQVVGRVQVVVLLDDEAFVPTASQKHFIVVKLSWLEAAFLMGVLYDPRNPTFRTTHLPSNTVPLLLRFEESRRVPKTQTAHELPDQRENTEIRVDREMRVEGQGTEAGGNGQDEQDLDTTPYCFCQQPAHGDMLGCDSGRCRYEWFHFSCLGITTPPPVDKWYCNDCGKG